MPLPINSNTRYHGERALGAQGVRIPFSVNDNDQTGRGPKHSWIPSPEVGGFVFQDLDGRTEGSPWRRRGPAGRPSKARAAQSTRSRTTTPTGGRVPPGRLKLTRGSKPPDHNPSP